VKGTGTNRLKFLEDNRKLKFAIALVVLATLLFAVPETVSEFVNWSATKEAMSLDPPGVPILLGWHLLDTATYAALVGSVVTMYMIGNVTQKVLARSVVSPPVAPISKQNNLD